MGGRPRSAIGTYGTVRTWRRGRRWSAEVRYRDVDGGLRKVMATGASRSGAAALLKQRLNSRSGYGTGGVLTVSSPFGDLAELWLADLDGRDISEGTKQNYREDLRVHVRPFFEAYTLGEITTGRVETFLRAQAGISYSRAKHSRTVLSLLFGFGLRNDAFGRNPLDGTSPLSKPKTAPKALTLHQVQMIRAAAAAWRTGPDVKGPKPDDKVRDAIEVLLGTSMRPGEVLALRPMDIIDGRQGLAVHVRGTVVYQAGRGTVRQEWPKTDASIRSIPVPLFAADVLRRRLRGMQSDQAAWTIFHNRSGRPLSMHNFRRTFREFLKLAALEDSGISPRWYRRTGATVLARSLGVDAAAAFLGHSSTAVTEGHYIEPDPSIDFAPAEVLERTLRLVDPDGALLAAPESGEEELVLDELAAGADDVA
jgi:integrase